MSAVSISELICLWVCGAWHHHSAPLRQAGPLTLSPTPTKQFHTVIMNSCQNQICWHGSILTQSYPFPTLTHTHAQFGKIWRIHSLETLTLKNLKIPQNVFCLLLTKRGMLVFHKTQFYILLNDKIFFTFEGVKEIKKKKDIIIYNMSGRYVWKCIAQFYTFIYIHIWLRNTFPPLFTKFTFVGGFC